MGKEKLILAHYFPVMRKIDFWEGIPYRGSIILRDSHTHKYLLYTLKTTERTKDFRSFKTDRYLMPIACLGSNLRVLKSLKTCITK
ncbi:hypothetical protein CEXT_752221 [Caerostris extrusa]|uniref:Uncharacterized protein n=1 Tax=Caerostris extrusa TaxID=172846 RepID=A0AAV4QPR2_CAEEX|nr:hypothetical protein CEXT_752221 [Caerostris extrusa]